MMPPHLHEFIWYAGLLLFITAYQFKPKLLKYFTERILVHLDPFISMILQEFKSISVY